MRKEWTEDEINYLINNYSDKTNEELAIILNRSKKSINIKGFRLGLEKSNIRWTDNEVNYLINNYSDKTNQELSINLNKSKISISIKGNKIGLIKSKEQKSKITGKRNKMVGRDLSFEFCKEIASKCKTRGELQFKDSSVYTVSRKSGWLDDICIHMVKLSYSIPQMILTEILKVLFGDILLNDKSITKPYELDIYIPKYKIAFEYDGKRWHENNSSDEIKNKLCIENNIKLIRIIENNRKYESDIKDQLIYHLDDINEYCKTNFTKEYILNIKIENIFDDILDDKEIKIITEKYDNYSLFKKENSKLFFKLYKLKMLNKYTSHMNRNVKIWSNADINYLIKNYNILSLEELMNNLNTTKTSIYVKSNRLGLKKRGN